MSGRRDPRHEMTGAACALAALFCGMATGALGCTVGAGSGQADGSLFILDCNDSGNYGIPGREQPYQLKPKFFAGEPIEDIRRDVAPLNRVILRAQRDGARAESNDSLYIDITNSFEVARCVRGRVVAGQPDYDVRACSWASGVPRIRVGRKDYVRATLTPFKTCDKGERPGNHANVLGVAVSRVLDVSVPGGAPIVDAQPAEQWLSWVELTAFGDAEQPDKVDPSTRDPIGRDFKVEFGSRVHVSAFHLQIDDERVWFAVERFDPLPMPSIGGTLDGFIDFDLERGRAAQTFP